VLIRRMSVSRRSRHRCRRRSVVDADDDWTDIDDDVIRYVLITAAVPSSNVEAAIRSPTNMAAAKIVAVDFIDLY